MATIGDRIKICREREKMTQEELGKRVGVTGVAIMRYEKGTRQPRPEQLQRIAAALNVSAGFLLDGRERKKVGKFLVEKVWKSDKASRLYMCIDSTLLGDLDAIAKMDNMSLEDEIEEILYWEVENRHEKWEDEESSRMMQEWYNIHHTDTQDATPVPDTIGQELDAAEQKSAETVKVEKQKKPIPVSEDEQEELEEFVRRHKADLTAGQQQKILEMMQAMTTPPKSQLSSFAQETVDETSPKTEHPGQS